MTRAPGAAREGRRLLGALAFALACGAGAAAAAGAAATWLKLAADGIHDPASPALRLLQEPAEALAALPRDTAGNQVDWMKALDSGAIKPRSTVDAATPVRMRYTEVLMRNSANQFMVRFPHRQHTAWIDCVSCHDVGLFAMRAGSTRVNMFHLLSGDKCGRCHGAVAFPLTECRRCHSVPRGSDAEREFGGKLVREARSP